MQNFAPPTFTGRLQSKTTTIKKPPNRLTPGYFINLRVRSDGKPDQGQQLSIADPLSEQLPEKESNWIVCRQCRQKLTKFSERVSINGSHRYTFANPNGIVFEIGCFARVGGCSLFGLPSNDFTWFSGHTWQILICSRCQTHIGWLFTATSSEQFSGLILDRLSESLTDNR